MRIVIVGAGDIGLELAENFVRREKNELVIIDADEKRCEEISNRLDALALHGDGIDPEILEKDQLEGGKLESAQVSEVEMPDGAHLVAVLRDEQILIPHPKIKLKDKDELIVLVEGGEGLEKVKKMLKTKD